MLDKSLICDKNPALQKAGFFESTLRYEAGFFLLPVVGRWFAPRCWSLVQNGSALLEFTVRVSRAALQSCPTPGLRGRLIHGRLLHSASASTLPELSGFGPSLAEWLARSFPRLLEHRRSKLCNAARDRTEQTISGWHMSNKKVADAVQQKESLVNREERFLFTKLAIC